MRRASAEGVRSSTAGRWVRCVPEGLHAFACVAEQTKASIEQFAKPDLLLQEAALDTTRPQCGARGSVGLEVGAVVAEALLQREIWLRVTECGLCGQCPCFFL